MIFLNYILYFYISTIFNITIELISDITKKNNYFQELQFLI